MTNGRANPTASSHAVRRARRWSRRGISLIEVVMASMLLAIIASAVVGGITTVVAADSRNQQKLEALELANRLLLQYVDDKDAMPDQELHVTQGRGVYRWVMRASPVQITMPEQSVVDKPTEGPSGKVIDKLKLLAVSVYTGVPDSMGGYTYGERVCTLSRVYHPLSVIYRNPNKLAAATGDVGTIVRLFSDLLGTDGESPLSPAASGGGGGAGSSTNLPRSGTPKPVRSGELFTGTHTASNRTN